MIELPKNKFWYLDTFIQLHCRSGHLLFYYRNGSLSEGFWCNRLPGRITHMRIFDFNKNEWNIFQPRKLPFPRLKICAKQWIQQQKRKQQQLFETRKAWLGCAIRLKVVPDIRKLIGTYLNREPFDFWKK
jgi:hypothetical protein